MAGIFRGLRALLAGSATTSDRLLATGRAALRELAEQIPDAHVTTAEYTLSGPEQTPNLLLKVTIESASRDAAEQALRESYRVALGVADRTEDGRGSVGVVITDSTGRHYTGRDLGFSSHTPSISQIRQRLDS